MFNSTKLLKEGVVYRPHLQAMQGQNPQVQRHKRPLPSEGDTEDVSVKRQKMCETQQLDQEAALDSYAASLLLGIDFFDFVTDYVPTDMAESIATYRKVTVIGLWQPPDST